VVRINDRGILDEGRIIDLSYAAAQELNITKAGLAPVALEVISLGHPRHNIKDHGKTMRPGTIAGRFTFLLNLILLELMRHQARCVPMRSVRGSRLRQQHDSADHCR